ncbi:MAG: GAF domain-containing sensor histidine kinase, partial [Chloroflexota bacterium]
VAEVVIEQSLQVLAADSVGLWLADPAGHELTLFAHRHFTPATVEMTAHLSRDDEYATARAARTGQIQVMEDLSAVATPSQVRALYEREGAQSLLSAPLRSRGKLVGVVTYLSRTAQHFSPHDLAFNATVADLFAVAIADARLYDQVREALRLRDEFMRAAAHELRTPVTTIKGWAELLIRLQTGPNGKARKALETIVVQSDRITRLIEDLLTVVRLYPGVPTLDRQPFDLSVLVRQVVAQVSPTTEQHQFTVETPGRVLVEADQELILELMNHLLENAMRYSPSGGPIAVTIRKTAQEAIASVTDRGIGIEPERQPYIFEPFYEPVAPGMPGYLGIVSLGLHLSKQIVEAHGGRIWFESKPGQGSTFSFSLPLAKE